MSVFSDEDEQKLVRLAGQLYGGAKLQASTLYPDVAKTFPLMAEVELARWVFIYSVAAIYVAADKLDQPVFESGLGDRLWDIITENLTEDKPALPAIIQECSGHCQRISSQLKMLDYYRDNASLLIPDIVGSFMMKFLFGHDALSKVERHMARSIGSLIVDGYDGYWTANPSVLN